MRLLYFLFCLGLNCFIYPLQGHAQCTNRMLDFDGVNDYVQAGSPLPGITDFTLELWYKSANNTTTSTCNNSNLSDFRWLVSWDDEKFGLGDCNGSLMLVYSPVCPSFATYLCDGLNPIPINDGQWHHIALVQNAGLGSLNIYTDGVLFTGIGGGNYPTGGLFRLGSSGSGTVGKTWKGQMDEFRLWNTVRSASEISQSLYCTLNGDESGLVTYWPMDQGAPGGSNTSIAQLMDACPNGNNGILQGFSLNSGISNFLNANSPLLQPYAGVIDLEIKDYPTATTLLTEVCDGDPVHFCLLCEGDIAGPYNNIQPIWEYNDGTSWQTVSLSDFEGFCFIVPASVIQASCASNPDGFVDRRYRARFDLLDGTTPTCTKYSKEYALRICCPLTQATVDLQTNFPNNLLCEGDVVDYTVSLNSNDLFVQNLGPQTHIEWYFNGVLLPYNDQLSFTYQATANATTGGCFEARLQHCSLKTTQYNACAQVDKKPQCGLIEGVSTPNPLEPDPADPNPLDDELYYLICPENAAVIGMIDPADFKDAITVWQYSFDQLTWVDLGSTNSLQNTNILPSYYWPSNQTVIYYRIAGYPLSWPNSGCEPCFSNLITIHLKSSPLAGTILGDAQVCKGNQSLLEFDNPQPGNQYQWYCNGLPVGTDSDQLLADRDGCYWVEVSNNCTEKFISAKHCLEVCEVIAVLSCPLPPNTGACKGHPIELSACGSSDSCGGVLSYVWSVSSGGSPTINGCQITHTPDDNGTTYSVAVTSSVLGCSASTSFTVLPCDKN